MLTYFNLRPIQGYVSTRPSKNSVTTCAIKFLKKYIKLFKFQKSRMIRTIISPVLLSFCLSHYKNSLRMPSWNYRASEGMQLQHRNIANTTRYHLLTLNQIFGTKTLRLKEKHQFKAILQSSLTDMNMKMKLNQSTLIFHDESWRKRKLQANFADSEECTNIITTIKP